MNLIYDHVLTGKYHPCSFGIELKLWDENRVLITTNET